MKNQEILNDMYKSVMEVEVKEKIFVKVFKKIVSIISKIMGVAVGTFAFLLAIFEVIIIFVGIREKTNIIEIINKSVPITIIFVVAMIIHAICLEVHKKI